MRGSQSLQRRLVLGPAEPDRGIGHRDSLGNLPLTSRRFERLPKQARVRECIDLRASGDYADKIVCFYLAAGRDPAYLSGMHVHEPLKLLAMSGTHTRPITFDQVMVPDTSVAALIDFNDWQQADDMKTIDVNPASFGSIRGAVQELSEIAEKRQDPQLFELIESFATRARELRRRAYAAIDSNGPADERISLRAQALRMAIDAATAVVTARAGAAMYSGCSSERRVREAMFLQVQAQTAQTRAASLSLLV